MASSSALLALGLCLGIFGTAIAVGVTYYALRAQKRRGADEELDYTPPVRHSTVLDRSHPASRITPFGSATDEAPQHVFNHSPGKDMRIAHRQLDGSWRLSGKFDVSCSPSQTHLLDPDPFARSPSPSITSIRNGGDWKDDGSLKNHKLSFLRTENLEAPPPPAYSPR